jgi:hypothetical protein
MTIGSRKKSPQTVVIGCVGAMNPFYQEVARRFDKLGWCVYVITPESKAPLLGQNMKIVSFDSLIQGHLAGVQLKSPMFPEKVAMGLITEDTAADRQLLDTYSAPRIDLIVIDAGDLTIRTKNAINNLREASSADDNMIKGTILPIMGYLIELGTKNGRPIIATRKHVEEFLGNAELPASDKSNILKDEVVLTQRTNTWTATAYQLMTKLHILTSNLLARRAGIELIVVEDVVSETADA